MRTFCPLFLAVISHTKTPVGCMVPFNFPSQPFVTSRDSNTFCPYRLNTVKLINSQSLAGSGRNRSFSRSLFGVKAVGTYISQSQDLNETSIVYVLSHDP